MRIGIDARTILNPKRGEAVGSGHYTYQLIKHLLDLDKENEYVLFFDFRAREKDIKKFTRPNTKILFYPFSDYRKYLPGAYNEILTAATLAKEKLDILHSTSPVSRIPTTYRGKTIATFHDMAIYKIPECFPKTTLVRSRVSYQLMANKVDKIIAVSNSIKDDLDNIFKVGNKTEVIYSGLDKRFFNGINAGAERILGKLELDRKYILFLGTIEPSKNITRMLQAFADFKNKIVIKNIKEDKGKKFDYKLLLVGKSGWLAKEYLQIAKDLKIKKDVVFAGYIIGDELLPLFKNAEFFILPSLYEGFGMTLLEAFATGTPAIVSKVSSLAEIGNDAAYFVNPIDVGGIAEAMFNFSQDKNMREEFSKKGLERAKDFDWEAVAQKTLSVYKEINSNK
ncbi:MAG: glycosyltransferase family 1 protein [Candidatus Moranbacteria bacterium]|jgi:glycosyltransferase involved in cell wall biosynthesis|nr:glycosyltransferase family 1 protein [Candidatus Moranbacteria bacterium]